MPRLIVVLSDGEMASVARAAAAEGQAVAAWAQAALRDVADAYGGGVTGDPAAPPPLSLPSPPTPPSPLPLSPPVCVCECVCDPVTQCARDDRDQGDAHTRAHTRTPCDDHDQGDTHTHTHTHAHARTAKGATAPQDGDVFASLVEQTPVTAIQFAFSETWPTHELAHSRAQEWWQVYARQGVDVPAAIREARRAWEARHGPGTQPDSPGGWTYRQLRHALLARERERLADEEAERRNAEAGRRAAAAAAAAREEERRYAERRRAALSPEERAADDALAAHLDAHPEDRARAMKIITRGVGGGHGAGVDSAAVLRALTGTDAATAAKQEVES